jgi:hypothetical protein
MLEQIFVWIARRDGVIKDLANVERNELELGYSGWEHGECPYRKTLHEFFIKIHAVCQAIFLFLVAIVAIDPAMIVAIGQRFFIPKGAWLIFYEVTKK